MKKSLILIMALISGCASMSNGTMQHVNIDTKSDGVATNTRCSLKNEEGAWETSIYEPVNIHRDGNAMTVSCENKTQTGSVTVEPVFNSTFLILDIILIDACTISCLIDGVNNAFYEYPKNIDIFMHGK